MVADFILSLSLSLSLSDPYISFPLKYEKESDCNLWGSGWGLLTTD